jgi:hypothetical protein
MSNGMDESSIQAKDTILLPINNALKGRASNFAKQSIVSLPPAAYRDKDK